MKTRIPSEKNAQPANYLDLIFQDRHKGYGAYQLRKLEVRHTIAGLMISALMLVLSFSIPYWYYTYQQRKASRLPVEQVRVVNFSQLSAPPPIEQPPIPPPELALTPQASVRHLPPVVKPDEEVPEDQEMPTVEELSVLQPGPTSAPGDSFVWIPPPQPPPQPGPKPEPKPTPKPKVFTIVEVMPEFPGGEQALYAFIRDNIAYPTVARENGISGKVFVRFTVQINGQVSDVRVVRGIGGGCDEEAIRVVRMLPAWKPGIQSGRAVAVEYTLPINFIFK